MHIYQNGIMFAFMLYRNSYETLESSVNYLKIW